VDPQLAKVVEDSIDKDWLQLTARELQQKFVDAHHA
jgi:hypothetical protein